MPNCPSHQAPEASSSPPGPILPSGTRPARPLTLLQERAVSLVLEGALTHEKIAQELGIERKTLHNWMRTNAAFQARLSELRNAVQEELGAASIASSALRMKKRNARWLQNNRLIDQRAAHFAGAPQTDPLFGEELATGMYRRKVRRRYKNGQLVSEVIEVLFDSALHHALVTDELQAARELGQLGRGRSAPEPTRDSPPSPSAESPIPPSAPLALPLGFAQGGIADALRAWQELAQVGRLPTTAEEVAALLAELDARERAQRAGQPVPPLSEPYS